ncbi:MFS transporter (plasmid) [Ureibacillus chungkukjangi]|nr:MFS transporter [Ureibacillus chungkukjangi]MCM3390620.1 MFS transporter [Ureibacillus chungkukjangi]
MLELFKNKNFSSLFFGRLMMNIGDSIYYVAATWLVYELGGSVFYSGLAGFLILIPELFSVFIGPIVDRYDKKKLLMFSSVGQSLLILLIPFLSLLDTLTVTIVLVIMPLISFMNLFTYPTQNALLPQIVEKSRIIDANSAMAFSYQGMNLIFNGFAGVLISVIGIMSVYYLNSIVFILSVILFASLKLKNGNRVQTKKQNFKGTFNEYKSDLREGMQYFWRPSLINLILPLVLINFTFSATLVVFPEFADVSGGVQYYGILMVCYAGGMLVGSLLTSFITKKYSIGILIIFGFGISGVSWVLIGPFSNLSIILSCLLLFVATIPIGYINIILTSYFQTILPQNMIGRVGTIIESVITIAMPIGSLLGGYLGASLGTTFIIMLNGFIIIIMSIYWMFNRTLRGLPNINKLEEEDYETQRI